MPGKISESFTTACPSSCQHVRRYRRNSATKICWSYLWYTYLKVIPIKLLEGEQVGSGQIRTRLLNQYVKKCRDGDQLISIFLFLCEYEATSVEVAHPIVIFHALSLSWFPAFLWSDLDLKIFNQMLCHKQNERHSQHFRVLAGEPLLIGLLEGGPCVGWEKVLHTDPLSNAEESL